MSKLDILISRMAREVGGNWPHVLLRISQRVPAKDRELLHNSFVKLRERAKARAFPQGYWNKRVRWDGREIGIIVGHGSYVASVMTPKMTPLGKEI